MVYSLAVTGPLGTGKTTFLRNLNNTLLTKSKERYSNTYFAFNDLHRSILFPRRFDSEFDSYAFQLSCMLSNYEQILRCDQSQLDYITDFWFGETLQVYAKTYFDMGFITADHYNSLMENNYLLYNLPKPKKIVYIKYDSPKDIVNNILARGRYNESEESREFLESFVTYLLENFDMVINNVQTVCHFDVITLRQHQLEGFIDNFCNEQSKLVNY